MTASAPVEALPRVQRRTLIVLVAAQVLGGAGPAVSATVVALLAQDMLGSTSLAGLPSALVTTGSALAAAIVGWICQAHGRRPGLVAGYLSGAVGSAGVITAAVIGSPLLFLLALFVYGAGMSTNLQARYAGADLAVPARRARAVSTVLVATTLGGVVGPNLAAPAGEFARGLGIPHLAGPFLLAGAAYVLAAVVLAVGLRPDPLLLARNDNAERPAEPDTANGLPHLDGGGRRSVVLVGALVMVLAQLVTYPIMMMTPVHVQGHGHGTAASGFVIAVHIGAMFLPSPLTGWLVDRHGPRRIAAASGLLLLAGALTAAVAPGAAITTLAVALALLGLGWNLGMISGTAMITHAAPPATRARTQSLVDAAIAIAGATGGMASGLVVDAAGLPALALAGGLVALVLLATLRRGT
ncbi:MFS transporter [Allokutzneria albata]|uniref:Predicted arabinose efflux permease, MFS family n=1 Tax=Allokutzneria albata TaxID=211114 RepID=A0A1G9T086_ALLAB|nr:MFS transporter [Allokutzneria albata]SDM41119.1 Predicted arabinose efflux permease, MFS family [Allokutzneria albata]